ncbi:hypothetical protein WJX81_003716 [Elliptochloris bilobata]|uniref:Cellulose synthase (UDP-forming) n=1 Tax=Elliptochloris bilobata TaxID=381761 RepID=A0AAW1SK55_9CHLO
MAQHAPPGYLGTGTDVGCRIIVSEPAARPGGSQQLPPLAGFYPPVFPGDGTNSRAAHSYPPVITGNDADRQAAAAWRGQPAPIVAPHMAAYGHGGGGQGPMMGQRDEEAPGGAKGTPWGSLGMLGYRYHRNTSVNWLGWGLFLFYLATLGYYLYVRLTSTLNLGLHYQWYGVLVLVVEVMGASTVVLYGVNLLFLPEPPKYKPDPGRPGLPKVTLPYHVRVLVPCYREELEIVQRTVLAALDADLPAGCARTVYLCDDGKDPEKRKWVAGLQDDVVYISGRARKPGEMNGKSGNLNFCAAQLYPKGVPIPGSELIAVFDADQVAKREFWLRTVPLFDGGDDVGMVLSPQCFHNLRLACDIFNHANVHFWEYMQPGYDALGFISCTGTNFLVRAKAFMEAGGSPTYTLTEDFALGLEMAKWGWRCRYVQEYLAIGEAPTEIRNCFQQRSRWTKGHFQIIMNLRRCPLFQFRLRPFDRVMYCSGVWSYIVGAVTTFTFLSIPLLTIWIGVFPVALSKQFALALTLYSVAMNSLLYYVRVPWHVESLWFANVCNQLMWWAYVKAFLRSLLSRVCCCFMRIAFKATAKGKGRLGSSAAGDIWLHCLFFVLLATSIGVGIWQLVVGDTVINTLLVYIHQLQQSANQTIQLVHN